jgi:hypothetical protein
MKYAEEDVTNKLPQREDTVFDNISRVLRSRLAKQMLFAEYNVSPVELENFKREWNKLSPLYPNQTAALRKNHSSKAHLKPGEASAKANIPVVYIENDREERDALEWFNGLQGRAAMIAIKTAYHARGTSND